jgi:hypothetical protein
MRARLCVGLVVHVRMDNGDAVDDMAMVKETDIRIVKCEYHNQDMAD